MSSLSPRHRAAACTRFRTGTCPVLVPAAGLSPRASPQQGHVQPWARALDPVGLCPFFDPRAGGMSPGAARGPRRDMSSLGRGRWTSCRYVQSSPPAEGMSTSERGSGSRPFRNSRACSARCGAPAFSKWSAASSQVFPGFGRVSQCGVRPAEQQACLAQNLRRRRFRDRQDLLQEFDGGRSDSPQGNSSGRGSASTAVSRWRLPPMTSVASSARSMQRRVSASATSAASRMAADALLNFAQTSRFRAGEKVAAASSW